MASIIVWTGEGTPQDARKREPYSHRHLHWDRIWASGSMARWQCFRYRALNGIAVVLRQPRVCVAIQKARRGCERGRMRLGLASAV